MLKGFVLGEEKDIKRITMKGKNLLDYNVLFGDNPDRTSTYFIYYKIVLEPNTQYTMITNVPNFQINQCPYMFGTQNVMAAANDSVYSNEPKTITSNSDGSVFIACRIIPSSNPERYVKKQSFDNGTYYIMLNLGSTALPYEPYGYQEGWEVRDNQDRLIWGREDELQTATGTLPFKGYGLPLKVKSLLGNTVQNGTPAPDNIITPEICGVRTGQIIDYTQSESGGIDASGTLVSGSALYRSTVFTPVDIRVPLWAFYEHDLLRLYFYKSDKTFISRVEVPVNTTYQVQFPENTAYIKWTTYKSGGMDLDEVQYMKIMLNLGSTALPYEPYGWKIPFENHGENLFDSTIEQGSFRIADGTESSSTTRVRSTFMQSALPAGTYTINASGVDDVVIYAYTTNSASGYDNSKSTTSWKAMPYTFTTENSLYLRFAFRKHSEAAITPSEVSNIMLALGSTAKPYSPYLNETIPVYLGEVPTVRRVKKLVLDGTETMWGSGTSTVYLATAGTANVMMQYSIVVSSHYTYHSGGAASAPNNSVYTNAGAGTAIWFMTDYGNDVDSFKAYLASEYAAGHPVTIWYVLANEQAAIVNEPLCKISTYADELTTIQVHGLSAPLYGIGDYKDTLNLSTGVVTRKVKKLVLTGQENWLFSTYPYLDNFLTYGQNYLRQKTNICVCTNLQTSANVQSGESIESDTCCFMIEAAGGVCYYKDTSVSDLASFKSWLQQQYAAGTPVTIWYILSTPTTETVTVPTGMTGEIEGYLTQISTPTPEHPSIPKWNGKEETGGTYAVTVYDLPEIETTTGKNTLTVDTTIAPYDVTINGHIKYTYWGKIREDVRSGLAQTKFPVGTILYDNEDESTGRAFQVVGYDKHFDPSLTARGFTHSMTLCQLKLSGPWQFDAMEAFLYTTVEMQPGTYKFKIPNYDTTYGGNKTYYFTSTASVPVDSQIVLKWDYQKPPASVTAYAGPNPQTKTTAITGFNALTLTEWVEGESPEAIDLGIIKLANNDPDSTYGKLNHIHRARYGSNNYYQSGLRQLLNTDFAANNWWHPTTIFDRPYGNRTTNGYLRSLNEDFINVLATPEITHITNNVFEYPSLDGRTFALNTEYKINTDKVFLLSHTEVGLSSSPDVGTILDYYGTHNTNSDRIKYRIDNGNAYYWWLRTPYPAGAYSFRGVFTSGALDNGGAFSSRGVAPAHIIQ